MLASPNGVSRMKTLLFLAISFNWAASTFAVDKTMNQEGTREYAIQLSVSSTIDRPAKEIWPHFIGKNKEDWHYNTDSKTYTVFETVAGDPGEVGEVWREAYSEKPVPPVHPQLNVYQLVKVIP